jgi:hypothetical protein
MEDGKNIEHMEDGKNIEHVEDGKNIEHVETPGAHFLPKTIENQKRIDELEKNVKYFTDRIGKDSWHAREWQKKLDAIKSKHMEFENRLFHQK